MSNAVVPCDGCHVDAEPFWTLGDQRFCRDCVIKAGGSNQRRRLTALVEEVRIGWLRGLLVHIWTALITTICLVAIMILGLIAVIILALLLSKYPADGVLASAEYILPGVAGGTFVLGGAVGTVLMIPYAWRVRPRRIGFKSNEFFVEAPFKTQCLSADQCVWELPAIGSDLSGSYLPGTKLLVVTSTNPQMLGPGGVRFFFACGFTADFFDVWRTLLRLKGVRFRAPTRSMPVIVGITLGAYLGGPIGILAGLLAEALSGQQLWITALGLIGTIDGCVWGIWQGYTPQMPHAAFGNLVHRYRLQIAVSLGAIAGFVLGYKIGVLNGTGIAIATGLANSVIMSVVVWEGLTRQTIATP